jgi:uncharacterized caspase-like protein
MARNWAIVVGINQYSTFLSPLKYAKQDAELMCNLFKELEFDEICLFTEDSLPQRVGYKLLPTYPSYGHLHGFLLEVFKEPFLSTGDNLWFFFAGHGMQYANRDYLMLVDTHPSNVAATGISVDYIQERLVRSGADNVILLLDACRNQGHRGVSQISREVRQGVITISSCSPMEVSWEVDELQHGVFTYCIDEALNPRKENLEKLRCATVEGLNNHLRRRVPFVCEWYKKFPVQNPFTKIAPLEKSHLILFPKYARSEDVKKLQEDAQEAFSKRNLDFAEQLCIRANEASQGQNESVLDLLNQIQQKRLKISNLALPQLPLSQIVGGFNELRDSRSAQLSEFRKQASQAVTDRLHDKYFGFRGFLTPKIQSVGRAFTSISTVSRKKTLGCLGLIGLGFLSLAVLRDPSSNHTPSHSSYQALESFLRSGNWTAADQETVNLILQNVGKPSLISLVPDDVNQVPCEVLSDIDRLWVQNSKGKFGFSVQKRVFLDIEKLAPTLGRNATLSAFNTQVGWNSNEIWGSGSRPITSGEFPTGHFPKTSFRVGFSSLIQKLSACQF